MKTLLLFATLIISARASARDIVLITGYDPFFGNRINNSWEVAKGIKSALLNSADVEIHTCMLPTIFDKAMVAMEECYNALPSAPALVLSLGEGPCDLKVETRMYNWDSNTKPDNAGVLRRGTRIIQNAPTLLGLRLNLPEAYCTLSQAQRKTLEVSGSPGNFVCNNTAYQFTHKYPAQMFGFVHVPGHKCSNNLRNVSNSVSVVSTLISGLVKKNETGDGQWPLTSNLNRLFVSDKELGPVRDEHENSEPCLKEFLKKWDKAI